MRLITLAAILPTLCEVGAATRLTLSNGHMLERSLSSASVPIPAAEFVTVYGTAGEQILPTKHSRGTTNGIITSGSHHLGHAHSSETFQKHTSSPVTPSNSRPVTSKSRATGGSMSPGFPSNSASSKESVGRSSTHSTSSQRLQTSSFNPQATGVDMLFPDGKLDCSTFPSAYGALPVDWVGLGGWAGIQQPQSDIAGFTNILTITSSLCEGTDCCTEGSFCSYACAPGLEKTQWPKTQGSNGETVGGLLCRNGKLHLTNPRLSKRLCMEGTRAVHVQVQNNMSRSTAVCRTDYPGTEGETIPLDSLPGTTQPLTCPDAASYFRWLGKNTSAQYYVNPIGVPVETACQWGDGIHPWGNFAPLNLGVGYSNGKAWLAMFQNLPSTETPLEFSVELVGNDGGYDNLIGRCKYSKGQFCSGDDYSNCSPDGKDCTVALESGTATFIFTP